MASGGNTTQGTNGMSYDFGIMIAQGTVSALAKTVAGVTALAGTVYALTSATEAMDDVFVHNQVAMGGYTNTLKAMRFFSDKIASGASSFEENDLFEGAKMLQRAGLDVKKNFDLINKSATATGMSFSQMAGAIEGGNFSALAEAGIITDRMVVNMNNLGMTAQQSTRKVLALLQQANMKGMFENTIKTFPEIMARFREFGKQFMRAIIGDPRDPEGFANKMKNTISEIADFFYKHLEKIKMVGAAIGKVLSFVVNVVSDFAKRVFKNISSMLHISDKFWDNFQKKLLIFAVGLEILRQKINNFFEEHGEKIKFFAKLLLGYLAFRFIDDGIGKLLTKLPLLFTAIDPKNWSFISNSGLVRKAMRGWTVATEALDWQLMQSANSMGHLNQYMATGGTTSARLGNLLLEMAKHPLRTLQWAFSSLKTIVIDTFLAMEANPMTWVVLAVVALVAIIYYWDDIRKKVAGVSDGMLALITIVGLFTSPIVLLIGLIMIVAKYWTEVKTILINVGAIIENVWNLAILYVTRFKDKIVAIINKVHILKTIFNVIKDVAGFVYNIIDGIVSKIADIGGWIKKILDWTGKAANSTADTLAKESGGTQTGNRGTTTQQVARQEAEKLRADGTSEDEIKKMQGANYVPPPKTQKTILTSKPSAPSSYTEPSMGEKTVNVNSGAVVINLGANSGIDEQKLARKIKQVLDDMGIKDDSRKK